MLSLSEIENVLRQVAITQRSVYLPTCPRCGQAVMECTNDSKTAGYLSRRAEILICPDCAMEEGAEDNVEDMPIFPLHKWALFTDSNLGLSETMTAEQLIENAAGYTAPSLYFLSSPNKLLFEGLHLKGSTKSDGQDFLRSVQAGECNLVTTDIYVVRAPENPVDKNAVELWYKGDGKNLKLGFVAASQAPIIATCLDNGGTVRIIKHDIIGEPDSFCGLFMATELTFPAINKTA